MATVSLAPPPSPAPITSRNTRVPLGNVPNAQNRTFEGVTAALLKRPRPGHTCQPTQAAPAKKQDFEVEPMPQTPAKPKRHDASVIPPRRVANRTRIVGRSPPQNPPNISTKQQSQCYEQIHQRQHQQSQNQKSQLLRQQQQQAEHNVATMLAWQRHYRKQFPTFGIYFDSIPDDVAVRTERDLTRLGARIEKFFSRAVTHVITTRQIPADGAVKPVNSASLARPSATTQSARPPSAFQHQADPALLRNHGRESAYLRNELKAAQGIRRTRGLDTKMIIHEDPPEVRRQARASSDILLKAREYGIKIWALEKLQRIMIAIFDNNAGSQSQVTTNKYSHQHPNTAAGPDAELSHLLRRERLHGPTDRDPNAMSKDMVLFKGPFIYIRDMKASHRPIMVREYQPVAKREDGDWPQFRSTAIGKCPFIDDHAQQREKKLHEQCIEMRAARAALAQKRAREDEEKQQKAAMDPPRGVKRPRTLNELNPQDNRPNFGRPVQNTTGIRLFEVTSVIPAKRQAVREIKNEMAFTSHNTNTKNQQYQNSKYAYEPAASGVQPSKLTSAIRSQCVSSHVDAPGLKAGMSRDMFELKRKVAGNLMERKPTDAQTRPVAARKDGSATVPNGNKIVRKPSVDKITEQTAATKMADSKGAIQPPKIVKKNTEEERRDRSGYCENCLEKFHDFDRHTASRRHLKFAMNDDNFAELDALLSHLRRPLKRAGLRRR